MAHLRPGRIWPTLIEYYVAGYRHLDVTCRMPDCRYVARVEIARWVAKRRNLPVNYLRWLCGGCGSRGVTVDPVAETMCPVCAKAVQEIAKP